MKNSVKLAKYKLVCLVQLLTHKKYLNGEKDNNFLWKILSSCL